MQQAGYRILVLIFDLMITKSRKINLKVKLEQTKKKNHLLWRILVSKILIKHCPCVRAGVPYDIPLNLSFLTK